MDEAAGATTKPCVAAGVAKWGVAPRPSWYRTAPDPGSTANRVAEYRSIAQTAPAARIGDATRTPGARHATDIPPVVTSIATRPFVHGRKTRPANHAEPPNAPSHTRAAATDRPIPARAPSLNR